MSRARSAGGGAIPAGHGAQLAAPEWPRRLAWPLLIAVATAWAYWPTLVLLWKDWQRSADYSVGQLVPLAALYILWLRRRELLETPVRACWWGVLLVLAGQALRWYGLQYIYESLERYSLVVTIAGLTLWVGGVAIFRKTWLVLAFLLLMAPLPGKVHNAIAAPLQEIATTGSYFVLELIGVRVSRDGNILTLNDSTPVGIADACSGLRMLTAFVVVACVFAMVVERPRWQRIALALSSVPVAVICNIIRVAATAYLFLHLDSATVESFSHDFAGVAMMPFAVGILLAELWIMNRLVLPDEPRSKSRRSAASRSG